MEYQLSNLPRYIPITPRSQVANSPVAAGHILLFSEDGETLTAKKSDGSFESVGGGMDFYKCSAINTSTTARPEGYTLKLHCVNAENPSDTLDYNFTKSDAVSVDGTSAWEDSSRQLTLALFGNSSDNNLSWGIKGPNVDFSDLSHSYPQNNPTVHPIKVWEVTSFFNNKNGKYYNATWTVSAAVDAATGGAPAGLTLGFHAVCQMDGMTPETVDLSFTMEDTAKTGWERTWLSSDGTLRLQAKVYIEQSPGSDVDDSARTWFITQVASGSNVWETDQNGQNGPADPWGMSTMIYGENSMEYALTWTVSEEVAPDGTWSGYKATQGTDGKYSFADTATTGLSYSKVKPVVGGIYTADALAMISSLYEGISLDGLVLYDSLTDHSSPEIGNAYLAKTGVTSSTRNGIPCTYFSGSSSSYIRFPILTDLVGSAPCTISLWCKPESDTNKCALYVGPISKGNSSGNALQMIFQPTEGRVDFINYAIVAQSPTSINGWFLYTFVRESQTLTRIYVNGVLNNTNASSYTVTSSDAYVELGISGDNNYVGNPYQGYLAGLRIYNRALSAAEITALASEFTPTA